MPGAWWHKFLRGLNGHTSRETNAKIILPIFDQAEYLEFNAALPQHLKAYQDFESDYLGAHAFLYAYKDNKASFNAYRRENEDNISVRAAQSLFQPIHQQPQDIGAGVAAPLVADATAAAAAAGAS